MVGIQFPYSLNLSAALFSPTGGYLYLTKSSILTPGLCHKKLDKRQGILWARRKIREDKNWLTSQDTLHLSKSDVGVLRGALLLVRRSVIFQRGFATHSPLYINKMNKDKDRAMLNISVRSLVTRLKWYLCRQVTWYKPKHPEMWTWGIKLSSLRKLEGSLVGHKPSHLLKRSPALSAHAWSLKMLLIIRESLQHSRPGWKTSAVRDAWLG